MEIMSEKLQPAEVRRHCVCVPKEKQHLFSAVGQKITVEDKETGSIYDVAVGSQYRLGMRSWYSKHNEVRPGDIIVFEQKNSHISVSVLPSKASSQEKVAGLDKMNRSNIRKDVLDAAINVLSRVEDGTVPGRIRMGDKRFSVEWGEDVKETEIIIGGGI